MYDVTITIMLMHSPAHVKAKSKKNGDGAIDARIRPVAATTPPVITTDRAP